MMGVDLQRARAAKRQVLEAVNGQPNINGVGLAPAVDGGWAVKVNLIAPDPHPSIPARVDGVDVRFEVVGRGFRQSL